MRISIACRDGLSRRSHACNLRCPQTAGQPLTDD
jgi:hypothetical protein